MSQFKQAPDNTEVNATLGFLKTVVSEGTGADKNDSDKENDHQLLTILEETSVSKSLDESSKDQVHDQLGQSEEYQDIQTNYPISTMAKDEEKEMWDEFYTEDDFKVKKDNSTVSNDYVIETKGQTTVFEVDHNHVLDKVKEEHEGIEDYSSMFDSSVKDDEGERANDVTNENDHGGNVRKKKRKKLFKRRHPQNILTTSKTTGGSHPDLGCHDNSFHHNNQMETMSESGGTGNKGRRLNRRKQVSRPRCAGPPPNGDALQQKYQELEQLVLKPLPNPAGYVNQTKQQMLRLQGLGGQYHASNQVVDGRPPPSGNPRNDNRQLNQVIIDGSSDQGYSTIRTIQVVQRGANTPSPTTMRQNRPQTAHHSRRRPHSGHRNVRPASAGRERPVSANHRIRDNVESAQSVRGRGVQRGRRNRNKDGRSLSGSGKGSWRSDSESKDYSSRDSHDASSDNQNRSNSRSPHRVQNIDTHLKNSDNPRLQQWLKEKNKLHRRQKYEERKKKREERTEKQENERKKQESFQDSDKKVKEWMVQKRREAWRKAKEEKRRANEEEKERLERQEQNHYTGSLRVRSMERPQSAPGHSERKMFIPIIRPDGDQATHNNTKDHSNAETPIPQPPKSKFVYKRPVSGRVRLMKLQQERKEDSRRLDMKKKEMECLTEEEKNRKMRMSYDQWLLKKRQENYEKRRKAARDRALAKSDPELDRIVPEIAKRRIENIQRGKKRIQTNEDSVDETVNKSFGGGDFGEEENNQDGGNSENSGLKVSGQKKSLGERPSSAKIPTPNGPMNPQLSKSPRRPKSAHPRVQSIMDSSEEERVVEAKEFKLPFPPELGVPKYVAERQEKLFSAEVTHSRASSATSLFSIETKEVNSEPVADLHEKEPADLEMVEGNVPLKKIEPQYPVCEENKDIQQEITDEEALIEQDETIQIDEKEFISLSESINAESFEDEEEKCDQAEEMSQEEKEECTDEKDYQTDDVANKSDFETDQEAKIPFDADQKIDDEENGMNERENKQVTETDNGNKNATPKPQVFLTENEDNNVAQEQDVEKDNTEEDVTEKVSNEETQENEKEVQNEEDEPKSEASLSKSSTKHVSFVEEAEVREDPLAGLPSVDFDFEDEAEDQRGDYNFFDDESPREEDDDVTGEQDNTDDNVHDERAESDNAEEQENIDFDEDYF